MCSLSKTCVRSLQRRGPRFCKIFLLDRDSRCQFQSFTASLPFSVDVSCSLPYSTSSGAVPASTLGLERPLENPRPQPWSNWLIPSSICATPSVLRVCSSSKTQSFSTAAFTSSTSIAKFCGKILIHVFGVSPPARAQSFSSGTCVPSTPAGKVKIYTRTGDKGHSSLYDGQRRRKDDPTFEALGDVDELNSALGLAFEYCSQAQLSSTMEQIEEIQSRLLDAGSAVATPLNSLSSKKIARVKFNSGTVEELEKWIDKMDDELPQLTSFILPSGGLPAASLHVARTICRRAERKVFALVEDAVVDISVAQYLNRLSDYLFTAARYTAMKLEKPETIWRINKR